MRALNRQNREAGFNLIEAAIVLGIVGLVVAGIWAAAAAAYENMRQQTVSKNILAFAQNIKNYYANSTNTTISTTPATLGSQGLIPRDWMTNNAAGTTTAINHPWGTSAAPGSIVVSTVAGSFAFAFNPATQSGTASGPEWQRICNNLIARNFNAGRNVGMTYGLTGAIAAATSTTIPVAGPGCTATSIPTFRFPIQG